MMVGDHYDTDILGALAVGLATIRSLTGIGRRQDFESATLPSHSSDFRKPDRNATTIRTEYSKIMILPKPDSLNWRLSQWN